MSNYGFIITRHVTSEQTNKYWNQCVKLIRTFYPLRKIVIIDDNSNQTFIKTDFKVVVLPDAFGPVIIIFFMSQVFLTGVLCIKTG